MDELRIGMSDNDVLAHYREEYPYIALGRAKEVYRTWLKFRHLGALAARAVHSPSGSLSRGSGRSGAPRVDDEAEYSTEH
jgi:hypothetical protein